MNSRCIWMFAAVAVLLLGIGADLALGQVVQARAKIDGMA